jgi:hypothetical protein
VPWETHPKDPRYWTPEYRAAREACLRAASWRCQRQLPGCQRTASQANHRKGIAADPHHRDLEAICASCHRKVTSAQGNAARHGGGDPDFTGSRTQW